MSSEDEADSARELAIPGKRLEVPESDYSKSSLDRAESKRKLTPTDVT